MKLLIDGDIIVYRMAWACQKTVYTHRPSGEFFDGKRKAKAWLKDEMLDEWRDDDWEAELKVEPWENCRYLIDQCVEQIKTACKSDDIEIFLSDHTCFRNDLATIAEYKAGRSDPPVHKDAAKNRLLKTYNAILEPNLEADDLMGMRQTTETAIVSIDKDLRQIPGKHYNFVEDKKFVMSKQEADEWFMHQLMTGDRVDNIKGLPGIGEAYATRILNDFSGDWHGLVAYVADLYDYHYSNGVEALEETARLVYILREGDTPESDGWRRILGE